MGYLYTCLATLNYGCGNIVCEVYNRKVKKVNSFCYTMMLSFVVALFYLCYGKFRFTFDKTTTIFGGLYAVCYCVCTVALLKALKIGYVSLTSLIFSYSLILPALFGIFAYSTSPSVAFYFGLALFAVSLFFLGKKKTSEEKKSFSVKWLIYVLAAFFANGGCSILQTHQQRLCNGNYKSEFMLTAMIIVFVFCLIITLVCVKKNKDEIATNITKGWYAAIGYGVINALLNLFVMLAVAYLSPGVVFPVICGGGLILTLLLSVAIFKEKLNSYRIIGFVIGVISIVLMNV